MDRSSYPNPNPRFRSSLRNRGVAWSYHEVTPSRLEFREGDVAEDKPDSTEVTTLKLKEIDTCVLINTVNHHTSEYDITRPVYKVDDNLPFPQNIKYDDSHRQLVIRRGQHFDLELTFNRKYDQNKDDLRFIFEFGDCPLPSRATHIEFVISDENVPKSWGAHLESNDGEKIKVRIFTPPTLFVGKWTFMVDVMDKSDRKSVVFRYKHKDPFYILFNPWCKDDQVYHHDEDLLEEYVLNQKGAIFCGSIKRIDSFSWDYGQFTDKILDHTIELLDRSRMPWISRGDPVLVSRKLSSLTNSLDNRGIVAGHWPDPKARNPYRFGTPPTQWDGSVEIINQYFKNKRRPVKYGQCWVFAGVLNTLCRALGIPCRLITNFESAHDMDGSITIDKYDGIGCDPLFLDLLDDSIWNFHCWNDAWMARPDLPEGYGGWQVIDATPQERSDGIFCCGPMSVAAVKEGQVCLQHDGPFIYAEVNADQIKWLVYDDGTMEQIAVNKSRVGQYMSTKLPACKGSGKPTFNSWCLNREDITHEYKYTEGSPEERASVMNANLLGSSNVHVYDHPKEKDVDFKVYLPDDIKYGDNFEIMLEVGNENFYEDRIIEGSLCVSAIYYTGVKYCNIKTETLEETIKPFDTTELRLTLSFDEYADSLVSQCHLMYSMLFRVKETNQICSEQEKFQLLKPKLGIQAPQDVAFGEKFEVEVGFRNPLPKELTECCLRIQGDGMKTPIYLNQENVGANEYYSHTFEIVPLKPGHRDTIVSFHAAEMENVCGSHEVLVAEPKDDMERFKEFDEDKVDDN